MIERTLVLAGQRLGDQGWSAALSDRRARRRPVVEPSWLVRSVRRPFDGAEPSAIGWLEVQDDDPRLALPDARMARWLDRAPADVRLHEADDELLAHLAALVTLAEDDEGHRHVIGAASSARPWLVPPPGEALLAHYRRVVGDGTVRAVWPLLLRSLRDDLRIDTNRLVLAVWRAQLRTADGLGAQPPSDLELLTEFLAWHMRRRP